jgi:hypothetical protein
VILGRAGDGIHTHADQAASQGMPQVGAFVTCEQPRPLSLFELIRGIVRRTDSLRRQRAQHMKIYAQTIEKTR